MNIYLSGIHYETDLNEIERVKSFLTEFGFSIIIPEEKEQGDIQWIDKLKIRLNYLQKSNAIYMMSDWKESIMARIELTAAINDRKHLCFNPEDVKYLITTLDG